MNIETLSIKEAEEIAYKTAVLVSYGWRKDYAEGGDWLHPEGKKLLKESTQYHSCGCCSKTSTHEHDTYSLEEAWEELNQ